MLIINPATIHFENQNDIVDYLTKGACPSRKNAQAVLARIMNPDTDPRDPETKNVYIGEHVVRPEDRELIAALMERVYENRRWNRNAAMIGMSTIALLWLTMFLQNAKENSTNDNVSADCMRQRLDAPGPNLD